MKLYLMRHGDAVDGADDSARVLSSQGVEEVTRMADWLRQKGEPVWEGWHSGKSRAQQTAEIMSGADAELKVSSDLTPMADPSQWQAQMSAIDHDVALFSHLPLVDCLLGLLVGRNNETHMVHWHTATMVCLERTDDAWEIEWVMYPEVLPG